MESMESEQMRHKNIPSTRLKSYVEVVKHNQMKEGKESNVPTIGKDVSEAKVVPIII